MKGKKGRRGKAKERVQGVKGSRFQGEGQKICFEDSRVQGEKTIEYEIERNCNWSTEVMEFFLPITPSLQIYYES